jgi:hypothetical protein
MSLHMGAGVSDYIDMRSYPDIGYQGDQECKFKAPYIR